MNRCEYAKKGMYIEKGIRLCPEWRTFAGFLEWTTRVGWVRDLHIHRIDSTKWYSPDNCVLMTPSDHAKLHNKIRAEERRRVKAD